MKPSKTDGMVIFIFYQELIWQCLFVKLSIEDIIKNLAPNEFNDQRVYYALQAFFTALGIIAEVLWPKKNRQRGKELRYNLNVKDTSVLKNSRFRHYFLHIGQRIDKWTKPSETRGHSDRNIGSGNGWIEPTEKDRMRTFNPETLTLTFGDEKYELLPAVEAINELYEAAQSRISQPGKKRSKLILLPLPHQNPGE